MAWGRPVPKQIGGAAGFLATALRATRSADAAKARSTSLGVVGFSATRDGTHLSGSAASRRRISAGVARCEAIARRTNSSVLADMSSIILRDSARELSSSGRTAKPGTATSGHSLRHRYATWLLWERKASPVDVSTVMGYSDVSITLRVYASSVTGALDRLAALR